MPPSRVVAVQGTAQLTSALAAMRAYDRKHHREAIQNHLIVHDLSAPGNQAEDFVNCLRELSKQATSWASFRYVSPTDLQQLDQAFTGGGWVAACRLLREWLSIEACEQLLLGQNLLFMNKLIQQSYPVAETACYGDGIGLNFSSDYYSPRRDPRGLRALERWMCKKLKAYFGGGARSKSRNRPHLLANAVEFQRHYLLMANCFDQHLPHFEQLDATDFCDLFATFAESLPRYAKATCDQLEAAIHAADQVVILLTSNFSETKRMTLQGELECCVEQARRQCRTANALLIIKPHPRDSHAKTAAIKHAAAAHFRHVIALSDAWTFFIPFESIFARFIASNPRTFAMTSVVCSSSACVSLELLYRQKCELGFGRENVAKHFAVAWQELRQRHEADLHRLLARIRHQFQFEERMSACAGVLKA